MDPNRFPGILDLPFSPAGLQDNMRLRSVDHLLDRQIVMTEKVEGVSIRFSRDGSHVRASKDFGDVAYIEYIGSIQKSICDTLVPGVSLFCQLPINIIDIDHPDPAYLFCFAAFDERNSIWWSWDAVVSTAKILGIRPAPILFIGTIKTGIEMLQVVENFAYQVSSGSYVGKRDGIIVRITDPFTDFHSSVAKWQRRS